MDVWRALEQAQLADMVKWLPEWLDTRIGDRGVKLSGWERQRLGLARMFFKNPKIIILDEPTSALDSISEHEIALAMKELFIWKTVIVIAHRLQTVMHADHIYVLEKGEVVQAWKHDELLKQDGLYKQLLDLQQGVMKS